jgi:hypothetical protein
MKEEVRQGWFPGPNVRIKSKGTLPRQVEITTESGEAIHGVRSVTIEIDPSDLIRAEIRMVVAMDLLAVPQLIVVHPLTGEKKKVAAIVFQDGEIFSGVPKPDADAGEGA